MIQEIHIPNEEEVFAPVFHKLYNCDSRFIINYGGTASGKSYSAAQKEVIIACEKKVKTLVIRKVANTLKDSVIPSFKSRIEELQVDDIFIEHKQDKELHCTQTGSLILFRG